MRKGGWIAVVAVGIALFLSALPVNAAIITYTSGPSWTADIGSVSWTQDFQSFAEDTDFRTDPVTAGHLTLQQVGSDSFRNLIDVVPLVFPTDGATTNAASMFNNFDLTSVKMTFDQPLGAWGGDFFKIDAEGVKLVLNLAGGGSIALDVPGEEGNPFTGFFGWRGDASELVTEIQFLSRTLIQGGEGEGYYLDNIAASTGSSAVPEPATLLLLGSGIGAVVAARFRRKK